MAVPAREVLILVYFPYAYYVLYATFLVSGYVLLYGVYNHLQRFGIRLPDVARLVV